MSCFFVCDANNIKPIRIDETPMGIMNKPLPKCIIAHIKQCPYCHRKYKATIRNGIVTFQHIENALYLATHIQRSPEPSFLHHQTLSISPPTPVTPKTPTIDPDTSLNGRPTIIKYSPSRSGTYTTDSPNTSVLVEIHKQNMNKKIVNHYISAQNNMSTSLNTSDPYINALLSPILNDLNSRKDTEKDITSKCLPPPLHRFNKLHKKYTKRRKHMTTPSNTPKNRAKHTRQTQDERRKRKLDKITKKLQKLKDSESKRSLKTRRKYRKDEAMRSTHIHHHHQHYHQHLHHHPDTKRNNALKDNKHNKYRHGDTNGFFTEKYRDKYMDYFQPKTKKKNKGKKLKKHHQRYELQFDEGHTQKGTLGRLGSEQSQDGIFTNLADGKRTKSESYSYDYHSD